MAKHTLTYVHVSSFMCGYRSTPQTQMRWTFMCAIKIEQQQQQQWPQQRKRRMNKFCCFHFLWQLLVGRWLVCLHKTGFLVFLLVFFFFICNFSVAHTKQTIVYFDGQWSEFLVHGSRLTAHKHTREN